MVANGLVPDRHHDDAGFCTAVGLCHLCPDLMSSTCILSNVVSRRRTCRGNDAPRRENFAVLDFSSMPSSLAVLVLLTSTRVAAMIIMNPDLTNCENSWYCTFRWDMLPCGYYWCFFTGTLCILKWWQPAPIFKWTIRLSYHKGNTTTI